MPPEDGERGAPERPSVTLVWVSHPGVWCVVGASVSACVLAPWPLPLGLVGRAGRFSSRDERVQQHNHQRRTEEAAQRDTHNSTRSATHEREVASASGAWSPVVPSVPTVSGDRALGALLSSPKGTRALF